jgi:hypothetical protein
MVLQSIVFKKQTLRTLTNNDRVFPVWKSAIHSFTLAMLGCAVCSRRARLMLFAAEISPKNNSTGQSPAG